MLKFDLTYLYPSVSHSVNTFSLSYIHFQPEIESIILFNQDELTLEYIISVTVLNSNNVRTVSIQIRNGETQFQQGNLSFYTQCYQTQANPSEFEPISIIRKILYEVFNKPDAQTRSNNFHLLQAEYV